MNTEVEIVSMDIHHPIWVTNSCQVTSKSVSLTQTQALRRLRPSCTQRAQWWATSCPEPRIQRLKQSTLTSRMFKPLITRDSDLARSKVDSIGHRAAALTSTETAFLTLESSRWKVRMMEIKASWEETGRGLRAATSERQTILRRRTPTRNQWQPLCQPLNKPIKNWTNRSLY